MLTASRGKARALRQYFLDNPDAFVREVLHKEPVSYQIEILKSVLQHTHTTVRSCHGAGKSAVTGGQIVPLFMVLFPNSIVITTAPTQRQVEGIIWREIRRAVQSSTIKLGGKLDLTRWKIADGWMALGFTAPPKDPDKFQGWHAENMLVVVDEAAGLSETIYNEGIQSIISAGNARLLLIGNPTSTSGEFYNSHKPESEYNRISISAFDTPNFTEFGLTLDDIKDGSWKSKIGFRTQQELPRPYLVSPHWVASVYRSWGEKSPRFQARVLARFSKLSGNTLTDLAKVEAAYARNLDKSGVPHFAVDVAHSGSDFTVMGALWPSGVYRRLFKVNGNDTVEVANMVRTHLARTATEGSTITIDGIGVGAGVADNLIHRPAMTRTGYMIPVHRFMASHAASKPDQFLNRRAEAYWDCRLRFEEGRIDLDERQSREFLEEELTEMKWKHMEGSMKIQFERKEDFIDRMRRSPDELDTLSMLCNVQTSRTVVV